MDDEVDVVVCTIEKANLLVNRLLEDGDNLSKISVVVIDELHIIGDSHRGYILELLITKILTVGNDKQQLIGLSATLPNMEDLAKWMKAELYITKFRPVPLIEFVKIDAKLYNKNKRLIKSYKRLREDSDGVFSLCLEVVFRKKSVLLFCPTKNWCRKSAEKLGKLMRKNRYEVCDVKKKEREIVLEKLRQLPGEICEVLLSSIPFGIAYHHAGMTIEERGIVENAFRKRSIDILAATSTLAAGVNLPAYRVIFRYPYIGIDFLSIIKYKQMCGRAGRAGIDIVLILFIRNFHADEHIKIIKTIKIHIKNIKND